MAKFEFVKKYADAGLPLPERKTAQSAGYDLCVAEDTVIPPYVILQDDILSYLRFKANGNQEDFNFSLNNPYTLDEVADLTKTAQAKPTLVSTGLKCYLDSNQYLELSVRSSCPLKYWLIMGNSVGIIDADYCDNPGNEGEIYFQLINLSPVPIILKKGDIIGQGIIKTYDVVENDSANGVRIGGLGSTSNA